MPRRRWRTKARREPLTPAMRLLLEQGMGALLARVREYPPGPLNKPPSLEGYAEAIWFGGTRAQQAAWKIHEEELVREWAAARPGSRPWAWWWWTAREPRMPSEGEASYLRRLELLVPGEVERIPEEAFAPEVVVIPELWPDGWPEAGRPA